MLYGIVVGRERGKAKGRVKGGIATCVEECGGARVEMVVGGGVGYDGVGGGWTEIVEGGGGEEEEEVEVLGCHGGLYYYCLSFVGMFFIVGALGS